MTAGVWLAAAAQAVAQPAPDIRVDMELAELPAAAPVQTFRIPLADLGLTEDALHYTDRASQTVHFRARADHVLTRAELSLDVLRPRDVSGFQGYDVLLNGESVAVIEAAQLDTAGLHRRIELESSLLAGSNALTLRIRTSADAKGCGRVPPGTWQALRSGVLSLSSAPLPMPNDLAQLPLPFFDPEFDREQTLHFVLPEGLSNDSLHAAAIVAAWFALQGRGRLSFAAHVGALPAGDAVVLLDSRAAAASLGLAQSKAGESGPALSLRPNPRARDRKLLLVQGHTGAALLAAARGLVRDGYNLTGSRIALSAPVALAPLDPGQVPRWVTDAEVVLGRLPQEQTLRMEGGHTGSLPLWFRLPPDLFVWPRDEVELDLGYAQGVSAVRGPARLHVMLNGVSLGTLPDRAQGRATFSVPRSQLRGYNELVLQVSYDEAQSLAAQCDSDEDASAYVELTPDSTLRLGGGSAAGRAPARFTLWPDVQLFLYDGFPFTARADLSGSTVVLPAQPLPQELSTVLSLFSHFATVTGYVPLGVRFVQGDVAPAALAGTDVLLVAAAGRHPLFQRYGAEMPLVPARGGAAVQRPASATQWARYLTGRFHDTELPRARARVRQGPFGAAFGLVAPWDASRGVVVVTASDAEHMPVLSSLQGFAKGTEQRNDLLVIQGRRRYLFRIGVERGRGRLHRLLEVRYQLAHHWPLLILALLLAASAGAFFARDRLGTVARRRLHEAGS